MKFRMLSAKMMIAVFFVAALLVCSSCSRQPSYPSAPQNGQDIVVDASSLEPGVPKFYTYHYKDRGISYFLIKVDNKVSSFLDACASCYTHKQGYRYENGAVSCRYCNEKYPVYKLEKGLGGCYPIKVEGRMDKESYRIPVATLEKMADKF